MVYGGQGTYRIVPDLTVPTAVMRAVRRSAVVAREEADE
jgi:hypothetical protein